MEGKGSTFSFTLPGDGGEGDGAGADADADLSTASGSAPTVLVCDGDAHRRNIVKRFLEGRGCFVVSAATGAEALELALNVQPAVIVLDRLMPGLSVDDTAKELAEHPLTADIPVVRVAGTDRDLASVCVLADPARGGATSADDLVSTFEQMLGRLPRTNTDQDAA